MTDRKSPPQDLDDSALDDAQGAGSIIRRIETATPTEFHGSDFNAAMGNAGNEFHGSDFNTSKGGKNANNGEGW